MRVHARSFAMTKAISEYVWRRVGLVLDACHLQRDLAQVWVDDVNGDHGGDDKRCRISVSSRITGSIVVEAVHGDLYMAVDTAASRLKTALRRRLQRHRTLRRAPAMLAAMSIAGQRGDEPVPAA